MSVAPHYLSQRENWEAAANRDGRDIEEKVVAILRGWLEATYPGEFGVESHPTDLRQIYLEDDYSRNPAAYARPAAPTADDIWWDAEKGVFMTLRGSKTTPASLGCIPDVKLWSKRTGRAYFLECKRQNDSGNAHERCAKYATPSMIALIQKKLGGVAYHPVGYLFTGPLITKRKYILELRATFGFAADHLLLWKEGGEDAAAGAAALTGWVAAVVLPLLR